MIYLNLALPIVFNGIVFSILGVMLERLLIKYGLVRGYTAGVVLCSFFVSFMMRLAGGERASLPFWIAISVLIPVGLNRSDLILSLTKGRWWWKVDK